MFKKKIIYLYISLVLLVGVMPFPLAAQVEIPEKIVYGTVYNIFHDRYADDKDFYQAVSEDMESIKAANLNLVMPFPMGQWNTKTKTLEWSRTDHMVDQIEKNNLMFMPVMLKSTHRAYLPIWKWLEIPDAVREFPEVSRTTEDVKYLHPQVLEAIDDYFGIMINRYKESTSLAGYNAWNEPHYESIDEINIDRFRAWLKAKYETLEQLNRSWAEDYTDWDQITPLMRRNWESSMANIDWELFRFDNVGSIAEWCYKTIRKYDKEHFSTINPVGTVINNAGNSQWSTDGRKISPHTDVFGISFYPDKYYQMHKKPMPYWRYSCIYDVTRCDAGDKPYYLVEAQTNQQNGMGLFQFMSYEDIHLMSWMAFADNCKGIVFWKWHPFYRGQQAFGRGLTLANGDLAPRGQAVKDVGAVLKKYGELVYDFQVKQAETAILFDIAGYQKSLESRGETEFFMNESFEGTYKALFDHNISVDIVRTDLPLALGQLKQYKILFMPYQLAIRDETADLLKTYVTEGGMVVADARTAIMDELDFGYKTNPGAGLDELFAARRLDLFAADSVFDVISGSSETLDFQGIYFKEWLEVLSGGEVIARFKDGKPAVIENNYGKGTAILSATPLGGSYYHGLKNAGDVLRDFALKSGVMPVAELASGKGELMVKVHENEGNESLVYLINLSSNPFEGSVKIPDVKGKHEKAVELTKDVPIEVLWKKDELNVDIKIPPYSSKVIWIH